MYTFATLFVIALVFRMSSPVTCLTFSIWKVCDVIQQLRQTYTFGLVVKMVVDLVVAQPGVKTTPVR